MNNNKIEKKDRALLKPLFWDASYRNINMILHKRWIIERLLHFGRPEQIKWVIEHYSEDDIINTVKVSKSIDKRTANYWMVHFNIPKKEVLCLNRQLVDDYFH